MHAILSSLGDFLGAALRPRTPLAKAIMLVIVIKLLGVTGLRIFMAADKTEPVVDANVMARVLGVPARVQ